MINRFCKSREPKRLSNSRRKIFSFDLLTLEDNLQTLTKSHFHSLLFVLSSLLSLLAFLRRYHLHCISWRKSLILMRWTHIQEFNLITILNLPTLLFFLSSIRVQLWWYWTLFLDLSLDLVCLLFWYYFQRDVLCIDNLD